MLGKFYSFLAEECNVKTGQKILVAFSGGADSLALLHMLTKMDIEVFAAHCNFNLRGEESDADERFVQTFCADHHVKLFLKSFDTKGYSKEKGISIEMAARDLRYAWFQELASCEKFDWIATGHHKDDSIETFFLNLVRGTGVKGLTGIKAVTDNIIRPLLDFSRSDLETYCNENQLQYRTDSSNLESIYNRNKIRNEILPLFRSINPSFGDTMLNNMSRLSQVSDFLSDSIKEIKKDYVVEQDDTVLISLSHVTDFKNQQLVLFELLHPYGFNGTVVSEVVEAIKQNVSGKQFYSSEYRLIKDRQNLIILPYKKDDSDAVYYISSDEEFTDHPIHLKIEKDINADDFKIDKSLNVAQFDQDLLEYPLSIRRWKQGDDFRPLGMKNFKKLSDYFIDAKFSIQQKEEAWLMLSGNDIIWIIGSRTDDRYKITPKTKYITKFIVEH